MPIIHVRCGSGIWRVDPPPLEISHGKLYDQKYALDPPPSRKKKLSLWPLPAKKSVWIRAWNIYMYNRFVTRNDLWETLSSEYIEDSHTQADPAIYKHQYSKKKPQNKGILNITDMHLSRHYPSIATSEYTALCLSIFIHSVIVERFGFGKGDFHSFYL